MDVPFFRRFAPRIARGVAAPRAAVRDPLIAHLRTRAQSTARRASRAPSSCARVLARGGCGARRVRAFDAFRRAQKLVVDPGKKNLRGFGAIPSRDWSRGGHSGVSRNPARNRPRSRRTAAQLLKRGCRAEMIYCREPARWNRLSSSWAKLPKFFVWQNDDSSASLRSRSPRGLLPSPLNHPPFPPRFIDQSMAKHLS